MTEASNIADNTLEYTVRSLLWALRAPEILKAASGEWRKRLWVQRVCLSS